MNLKNDPTIDELAELFKPLNDNSSSHVMWVDTHGEVNISPVPANSGVIKEKAKFQYETLAFGNGYVGKKASEDLEYLEKELSYLKRDWANDARGYIPF